MYKRKRIGDSGASGFSGSKRTKSYTSISYPPRRKSLAHVETKYFDSFLSVFAVPQVAASWAGCETDPATLNTLFAPVQGSAINNREGRKVRVKAIRIRGLIRHTVNEDEANVAVMPTTRMILVQDLQTNGTQLSAEEVMSPNSGAAALTIQSFMSLENLGRFKILKDKLFVAKFQVTSTDGASTNSQTFPDIPFKLTYKFKQPLIVHFNGNNGGTVGDIVDNSFHLITNTTSGTPWLMSYNCRVYFEDG